VSAERRRRYGRRAVANVEWDPERFLDQMHDEIHDYDRFQEEVAAATAGLEVRKLLDLGIGTGETAWRVVALHPDARLTGVDASEAMLGRARERFPEAELVRRALEDELPPGPFDVVYSALAIHHLAADAKRDLFGRIASVLRPSGRFVLGDVVVPARAEDVVIDVSDDVDVPDTLADQLRWLGEAGFSAEPTWVCRDLVVVAADR
jgi:tRNA (cmo5U34)-methyltransferase